MLRPRLTVVPCSATALQSLEIACDTLLSGKAKAMIAGGFDDISEEGSYEFANMKATSNAETEFAMGREPTEMSRPTTTTRSGVCFLIFMMTFLANDHLTVHGSTRNGCAYRHECQNSLGAWRSHPWYSGVHLNIYVSLHA